MAQSNENQTRKGWKEYLLRSGVPLEYQVALSLAAEGMSVDADFSFLRRDIVGFQEWSVDIAANWYGPVANALKFEFPLLVECKYRSPEKCILFLEEPNIEYSPVTLGGTINSFDAFVLYDLPLGAFESLEEKFPYVYKGIDLYDRGAVEKDFRHGIQQLRYATPALLRTVFDFGMSHQLSEAGAIYFTKILVTNAPLRLLNRGADIATIMAASNIEEISQEIETAILFSDYGPDFEDHFRSVFEAGLQDRMEAAEFVKADLEAHGKKFRFGSDPVQLMQEFSKANRYECRRVSTQFFVTTLDGLPPLLKSLKQACRRSYRERKNVKNRLRSDKNSTG